LHGRWAIINSRSGCVLMRVRLVLVGLVSSFYVSRGRLGISIDGLGDDDVVVFNDGVSQGLDRIAVVWGRDSNDGSHEDGKGQE